MEVYGPVLADIRTGFVERKLDAKVVDSHFHDQLLIFIRKDFLDMFQALDGVVVAGELLSALAHKFGDVFSGCHFLSFLLSGEFGKDSFKILTRELPFKGDCARLIERLKGKDFRFKFLKVLEVVWSKNFSL